VLRQDRFLSVFPEAVIGCAEDVRESPLTSRYSTKPGDRYSEAETRQTVRKEFPAAAAYQARLP